MISSLFPSLFLGCTSSSTQTAQEPSFIYVEMEGDIGSKETPLPFSPVSCAENEDISCITFSIQTLDKNSDPYPFNGNLKIKIRPGRLAANFDPYIKVVDGVWSGEIQYEAAFGPTRIWFSDEGDKDITTEREPTFAVGVSDPIEYMIPTITEINNIEDNEINQLLGEFTEVRVEDRQVIATVIGTNGFWVTDYSDADKGNYASMYVYTFSKPSQIRKGYRLTKLTGGNQEYLGTTQLSFPDYIAVDEGHTVPEPFRLTDNELCDEDTMEKYESAMVRVENVQIPETFTSSSEEYMDYLEYGQWPVMINNCPFYADSSVLSYEFNPANHNGQDFDHIQGVITQIWSKWIVVMVDDDGLSLDSSAYQERSTPPEGPRRPLPRNKQ